MDGIETTRQIRKRVGNDVTIIILSAYDYSEIEAEAREAGVDEFIAKSLFRSRLTATLKNIIEGKPNKEANIETAENGKEAVEKFANAPSGFYDLIFMDIHMPGINGIQAMREIRKFNTTALFYVVSAYDKFDYAKEAIDLGVERYLTKPISKAKIIVAVEEATAKVDTKRNQRSNLLRIQEKLETVIPVVENSFVGSLLFQQEMQVADYYQQLLDIEEKQGYVMIIQFGQSYENGRLVSPVGMNVKAQDFYAELRDIVKSSFSCAVGSIMSNRIPIVVPCALSENPYEERIDLVEQARSLITRLEDRIEAKFRVGIGRVREMQEMERSYREALRALNGSKSRVIHIEDLSQNGVYDEEFPVEMEKNIFRYLEEGKEKECIQEINVFFDWMVAHYADDMNNIRLKTLEYIIWGEKKAFEAGAINYGFSYRRDYLDAAMACTGYEELRKWFLDKMVNACRAIRDQKEDQSNSAAKKAMLYIQENYNKDISLDDVSGIVNISPYYFSKIFKEETGENFIEYVTKVRIEKAKEFLAQPDISIKEAGIRSGYTDPNYFSRIFKKQTDMTPSEYKTRYGK